jgi:hypothetical protein
MAEGDAPIARECITTGHLCVSINQFEMSIERATRMLCRVPASGRLWQGRYLSQMSTGNVGALADVDQVRRCEFGSISFTLSWSLASRSSKSASATKTASSNRPTGIDHHLPSIAGAVHIRSVRARAISARRPIPASLEWKWHESSGR